MAKLRGQSNELVKICHMIQGHYERMLLLVVDMYHKTNKFCVTSF